MKSLFCKKSKKESKKVSPFSVKVWNAEGSPRQADEVSVGFSRTEDPCIQFKMAAAFPMRGFSRWQFVVLGRKTQVFNTVNQKDNF